MVVDNLEDENVEEADTICTCQETCPWNCKGECGCELCRRKYADFLSME